LHIASSFLTTKIVCTMKSYLQNIGSVQVGHRCPVQCADKTISSERMTRSLSREKNVLLKLVKRIDHTRMENNSDDLFSGLARVRNFTYDINVNEEAIFDHKFMVDNYAS
jgi:hypothetical protein